MSCPHGNHPDACDICDEVAAAYASGVEAERQRREWVGLTEEQMANLFFNNVGKPMHSTTYEQYTIYARAIEAKLKEKNA